MRHFIHRAVVQCVLAVAVSSSAYARPMPTLFDLGVLSGGSFSEANAVSADGTWVAGTSGSADGDRAIRWSSQGGLQDLGAFWEGSGGGPRSYGTGISGDGSVVVGRNLSFYTRAFRTTGSGPLQPTALFGSAGYGVSASGAVMVGVFTSGGLERAFRMTHGQDPVDLGTLPLPNNGTSVASAVSASGDQVAGWSDSTAGRRAFVWSADAGMTSLGVLPGGTASGAWGISADGTSVVGHCSFLAGNAAFRWRQGEGMLNLGLLPGGTLAGALGVSGDGRFVVGEADVGSTTINHAFLWSQDTGMQGLNTLLLSLGVDLTGWTLTSARAISADGRTIVGSGVYFGQQRGWVVTGIPSPGMGAMCSLSVAFFAARRRR